jgi:type IX secretion system PorP/SprF family membrane protein
MKTTFFFHCLFCAMLFACATATQAQDPHFSQYASSPMTINPASIGRSLSGWRFSSVYRTQWWAGGSSPAFNTVAASLEHKISSTTSNGGFSLGLSMLSEGSNAGLLKNNYFSGGISYQQSLYADGREALTGGVLITYANRYLDVDKLYFQSQFGSMGFQRSIPANDPAGIANNNYMDLSAGLQYSKTNERIGYSFGASIFHAAATTKNTAAEETYRLPARISLQAGVQLYLGMDQLHFSGIAELQSQKSIYSLGGVYKMRINDDPAEFLNIGLWKRFGDSFYPYIAIEDEKWLAGISYDVVTGSLKELYGSVQSFEFSLILKFGKQKTKQPVSGVIFY